MIQADASAGEDERSCTELATRALQRFRQELKGHLTLGLGACNA
jgi:hypothetical protein